ncbi:type VII secretion protein EccB [Amycolatopsis mongoliensis]|uniref:Type VII secretion protein EccB n=1 Tax=Amycolatopsis mongoliensis TaxID=715475 RepID=A0A9Y2NG18_9PSEU|nr:type VII secretion protein EccB [Amycolatopsis sp. 4-36]WIX98217.1 type VII secretion protein EccB [Amycolatopsis sp. 4-36]
MKSRKDQVQAYFFVVGRLAAAVTHGKPDVLEAPTKRMTTGTVLGFVLAAVIMGVFGIFGMFVPPNGDSSWRQDGAIVMDKTSGARYVYLGGQLRPVLNYSSARLVSGQSGGKLTPVSPQALAGTPVGQPIGIAGAPDSLPAADKVSTVRWTVCARSAGTAVPSEGSAVTLLLGQPDGAVLTDGQAFLVSAPGGRLYLVSRGKRFRVPSRSVAAALGYGATRSVDVPSAWLNTIPQGPDLAAPDIPGIGGPGPVVGGKQSLIGQIYQVRNSALETEQNYLVRRDGLAVLSRTGAALLLAAPSTRQAYPDGPIEPVRVGPDALTGLSITAYAGLSSDLPPVPPEVVSPPSGTQPCVRQDVRLDGGQAPVAELLPDNQVLQASVPLGTHQTGTTADRVAIPAGGGVLARDLPAPGASGGVLYLVTEVGKKYPLADAETVSALGYTGSTAVPVSSQLLNLLPTGPVLSVNAARQTQAVRS